MGGLRAGGALDAGTLLRIPWVAMRSSTSLRSVLTALVSLPLAATLIGCGEEAGLSPVKVYPQADVELVKDDLGITHVYARSDADAFFGQGYSMARDRLFEMELNRRQAYGTRAEVLGEGAVNGDIASRTMSFGKLGAADAARLGEERPADLEIVEAWVAGVNARIEEIERGEAPVPYGLRDTELGIAPARWAPADAFAIAKMLAFGLSSTLDYELLATAIMRLAPGTAADIPLGLPAFDTTIMEYTESAPPPAPPGPSIAALGPAKAPAGKFSFKRMFPQTGSNNWAIDAAHSENGRPLLAGDPHQPLTSPSRLWPTHTSSARGGGELDVIGFAFVGTPGVQLGHNAHLGWTATTNYADVMDVWDVPAGGTFESVKLGGEPRPIVTRTETIAVKGAEPVTVDIHEVPGFGVILPEEILPVPLPFLADGQILFNWIGFAPTQEAAAYFAIDRARNVDELDQAVLLLDVGAVNFVAADSKDITLRVHTHVPDRGDPSSRPMPWHLVSGDDPESFWTRGYLPVSTLPHLRSPASGFISTANNDPFGFTLDGSVENDPFYYGGVYATAFRAHRIRELIEGKLAAGKMTHADMEEIQRDTRQPMIDTMVPRLLAAVDAVGTDPKLVEYEGRADLVDLADRLAAWDGRYTEDSAEAVIFFAFQWYAARRVLEGPFTTPLFNGIAAESPPYFIGQLRNVLEGRFPAASKLLPDGPGPVLLGALDDTSKWLVARFGTTTGPFAWQDVHAAQLRPVLDGHAMPLIRRPGAIDTVNVSDCAFFDDAGAEHDDLVSTDGSVYRMVMSFDAEGRPRATIDFSQGTSGEPGDPHFDDQNALWAAAQHVDLPFFEADVDARAGERITLRAR